MRPVWTNVCLADHAGEHEPSRDPGGRVVPSGLSDQRPDIHAGHADPGAVAGDGIGAHQATEIPVLAVGLAVILTANALLLRSSLSPLLKSERSIASASALAAQENERRRIARELHDEIGQTLTVALLMLKRAVDRASAEIRGELTGTQEAVRASLDEVRSIARRLRPDALEDLGLPSALNALCSEFAQASGIVVVKHIAPQSNRLGPDVELVCYRIAQESLTNIARHAGASKVWLDLHAAADQLCLRIADAVVWWPKARASAGCASARFWWMPTSRSPRPSARAPRCGW